MLEISIANRGIVAMALVFLMLCPVQIISNCCLGNCDFVLLFQMIISNYCRRNRGFVLLFQGRLEHGIAFCLHCFGYCCYLPGGHCTVIL